MQAISECIGAVDCGELISSVNAWEDPFVCREIISAKLRVAFQMQHELMYGFSYQDEINLSPSVERLSVLH